jgi:hypothetical protein
VKKIRQHLAPFLAPLVALLLVTPQLLAPPRVLAAETKTAQFSYRWDADSTTMTYPKMVGVGGNPWNPGGILGTARIKTTGSSTTVAAVTAGQNPFANLGVDDVIMVTRSTGTGAGTSDRRVIVAKASADSVTVDVAVNWDQTTGFVFTWLDFQSGTGDTAGWIDATGYATKTITFQLEQISGVGSGIDVRWECRGQGIGALPNPVHPGSSAGASCGPGTLASQFCNFTTAGATTGRFSVSIPPDVSNCAQVRIGVAIGTSDAAEAVEGDKERITMWVDWAAAN